MIVGVDAGHNGGNFNDPSYIDQLVWNGREWEACNTTGTETDGGYTEAQFKTSMSPCRCAMISGGTGRGW